MTDRFMLFSERFVRMGVCFVFDHSRPGVAPTNPVSGTAAFFELNIVIVGLFATFLDEIAGQRLVARFLSDFIQTHQRQLDFRVPGIAAQLAFFGTKHRVDVIGKATSDVQQSTFSGGVEEGDCRFKQVSGAVELVAFGDVGPAQPSPLRYTRC